MMFRLYFIFLLLISFKLIGQTSSEKEFSIKYTIGKYNFEKIGEYEKQEVFKFIEKDSFFVLTSFYSIKNKYKYNAETKRNNRKISDTITKSSHRKFDKIVVENLIKALNQNENNFTSDFIESHLLAKITKKEILKIAKKQDRLYWFDDDAGKQNLAEIQSYKKFDQYIKETNPAVNTVMVFSDAWNFAEISSGESNYKMNFHSALGQPILINNLKQIINLNVNLLLLQLLPENSLLAKQVELQNIKTNYIEWFIENIN
ncbi:hypothetical protein [Flavobacterium chungangensis]|uniref:Uncharacterized protein n=1 Tax=Flavobacterium chungangensis TaxID=2708132 RepID=A0ABV8ZLQ7_9FLAO